MHLERDSCEIIAKSSWISGITAGRGEDLRHPEPVTRNAHLGEHDCIRSLFVVVQSFATTYTAESALFWQR
jgi:hypothetical protein